MDSHTLLQALIYLGSAALIVPIAVRLGLGSVLGYLIAGCIIGPWGLRLVTDAESILHFAEIGVVLMLFVIGLELDPQRLWKLRASVFGGGALQMVVCGGLIGLFCMFLGLRWQVAELIGMTLALSSTAIAMQAMNERNLTVSQVGRSAFAVLLFQDIAAIPLVAMIPLLAASGASTTLGAFALSALKVAGALALVVLLGRYVTRPALRFVARSGLREVFSAVALFLVFGFGLLLEEVGLSMAMARFWRAFCWRVRNIVMRWKAILNPLRGCCWGCSLLASACRLISARWWRIRCAFCCCWPVFWQSKSSCCGWSRGRWAYRQNSVAGLPSY